MGDVLFVAVILALFGSAWLLVRACERIIGPEGVTDITAERGGGAAGVDDEVMA